jgi:signal transduction histidine kinase/CheY-like chemotaxis protein
MTSAVGLPTPSSIPAIPPEGPVNILLVDDRPENLLALEAILEPLGETLVRALSGADALKAVLTTDFAVILLDVQMPGMNGFETAQLIKSRERSRTIPIIFLTAISKEQEYVFRGYEVGAVDYMSKPFQPDILRSKVAVFVDLYRKQSQLRRQEQQLRDGERRELELRHRTTLLESEARTAEIVGSAMDAIITLDDALRVTLFNAAAERMFGLRADEAVGRPVGELFPERSRDEYLEAITRSGARAPVALGTGDDGAAASEPPPPAVASMVGRRSGGEEFPVEASVSALALANGDRVYTLIARDVSERVRAEAELKATNEALHHRQGQLEEAMRARNRFYASMSHELRTPINAIIGYNTLLLDNIYGPLNEKQAQGLQRTHKAAKHLLELVNDVLDLSKIEAGKIELSLQPVPFPGIIEDLFVTVRPLADEHGSSLTLAADGGSATVVTDPRRVRQILLNLLSNAIKFGAGKPIVVECHGRVEGGVTVTVADQGTGISAEDLPRVFDEFVQITGAEQQTGTGLGLPISRRLAAILGGSLDAESTPGAGSRFTLVLPPAADGKQS